MDICKHLVRGLAAAALTTVSACAAPRAPAPDPVRAETYAYSRDDGAASQVVRAVAEGSGEALRAQTFVPGEDGGRRVTESATLDTAGHLVRLEIVVARGCDGAEEAHLVVDHTRGLVRARTPGGTVEWPVPTDLPWVVEPVGRGTPTPLTAWIGVRAAAAGNDVRVIRADARSSYESPAEQVAVAHELGATVVLGDAVADVDHAFVRALRPLDGGAPLARVDDQHAPSSCAAITAPSPDVVH